MSALSQSNIRVWSQRRLKEWDHFSIDWRVGQCKGHLLWQSGRCCSSACLSLYRPACLPAFLLTCLSACSCLPESNSFSVHSKDARRVSDAGHGFSFSFSLFNGLCGRIIRHTLWTLKYLILEVIQWKHILYVLHALWSNKENLQRYQKKIQNNTKTNKKNGFKFTLEIVNMIRYVNMNLDLILLYCIKSMCLLCKSTAEWNWADTLILIR